MLWYIVLVVCAYLFYLKYVKPLDYWKQRGVAYRKPLPMIGNMGPMLLRTKHVFKMVQDSYIEFPNERYSGAFQFMRPALMIRDLDLIKAITVKDFDHFTDHNMAVEDPTVDPLLSKNLATLKGQTWRDMRSTLSPAFTSSKMKAMFGLISDCAMQFMYYFEKENRPLTEVEMKDVFTRFTNDAIATTAFGVSCNSLIDKENEFYMMGKKVTNFDGVNAFRSFFIVLMPNIAKALGVTFFTKNVNDFFRRIVKETLQMREEKHIVRPDMIHLLMEARKGRLKHEETEQEIDSGFATVQESEVGKQAKTKKQEITDDDITAQALIFFFAGFETASTAMCFMAHELAVNPDIQQRLQQEVDDVSKSCNGNVTYEALLGMKYLDMVISEALRKYPPGIQIDRKCVKNYEIPPKLPHEKPLLIEKDMMVVLPVYGIHHDPEYFPNPEKFDPERFSDENKSNIVQNSYLPFGVGPRACIGSRFALLEVKILFFHILTKFSFEVVDKTTVPLVLSKKSFNLIPENGFWLGLRKRT